MVVSLWFGGASIAAVFILAAMLTGIAMATSPPPTYWTFEPPDSITAPELAKILKSKWGRITFPGDKPPPEIARYFKQEIK